VSWLVIVPGQISTQIHSTSFFFSYFRSMYTVLQRDTGNAHLQSDVSYWQLNSFLNTII